MGRHEARDLNRIPGLLSLSRIPLAAVTAALFHAPYARAWVVATAVAGVAAAFSYWRRAFRIVAVREAT